MTLPRICAARIKSGSADRNATPVVSPVLTAGKRFVPILWGGWHLYPSQQAKRSVGPCSPLRRGANCTSVYKEKTVTVSGLYSRFRSSRSVSICRARSSSDFAAFSSPMVKSRRAAACSTQALNSSLLMFPFITRA